MKRIAFYGGSFDPPHVGHLTIARKLIDLFALDEFVFIPAFHAPHKKDRKPTSAFHRFAMLAIAANNDPKIKVSTIELDAPEKPFTVETQARLKNELPDAEIFFVIGADSWLEITTWREWESVLTLTNIIVVTRPDYKIEFSHVTEEIRSRVVDLRNSGQSSVVGGRLKSKDQKPKTEERRPKTKDLNIYITDAVNLDVSATEIRREIQDNENGWREFVPDGVANYIKKYELYI